MKIRAVALMLFTGGILTAAGDPLTPVRIPRDTPLELRLRKTISSATARANDLVEFDVVEDVRVGGTVVISKGSLAWGSVVEASPKARIARAGKLEIDTSTVCLADGSGAALRAGQSGKPAAAHEGSTNESLFALPALPFLLFVYGKDVTIPEGRRFTVFTAEELVRDPAPFAGKGANRSCGPAALGGTGSGGARSLAGAYAGSAGLSMVKVESAPTGGEIYVDGKFFGSAPSTLQLSAGEHLVSVRLDGRKSWERVLTMTAGGEAGVSAILLDSALLESTPQNAAPKESTPKESTPKEITLEETAPRRGPAAGTKEN